MKGQLVAVLALAICASTHGAFAARTINTMADLSRALNSCLASLATTVPPGLTFSARVSFRRDGRLLGEPFVFFQDQNLPDRQRRIYRTAIQQAFERCEPLPFSLRFGSAMAGQPVVLHLKVGGGPSITL